MEFRLNYRKEPNLTLLIRKIVKKNFTVFD